MDDAQRIDLREKAQMLTKAVRTDILEVLSQDTKWLTVSEIAEKVDVKLSTASKHLKMLERNGFAYMHRQGKYALYMINLKGIEDFNLTLKELFNLKGEEDAAAERH